MMWRATKAQRRKRRAEKVHILASVIKHLLFMISQKDPPNELASRKYAFLWDILPHHERPK